MMMMQTRQRNNVANSLAMRGVDTDYLDNTENDQIGFGRSAHGGYSYNDELIFDLEL